jgi:hypothetical protein
MRKKILVAIAIASVHFAASVLWLMKFMASGPLRSIDIFFGYILMYTAWPVITVFKTIVGAETFTALFTACGVNSLMWGFGICALHSWLKFKRGGARNSVA